MKCEWIDITHLPSETSSLFDTIHKQTSRWVFDAPAPEAHRHRDGFGTTNGPSQQQYLQLRHRSLPGPVLSHSEKLQLCPLRTVPDWSYWQSIQNCCRSFQNVYSYHRWWLAAWEERVWVSWKFVIIVVINCSKGSLNYFNLEGFFQLRSIFILNNLE